MQNRCKVKKINLISISITKCKTNLIPCTCGWRAARLYRDRVRTAPCILKRIYLFYKNMACLRISRTIYYCPFKILELIKYCSEIFLTDVFSIFHLETLSLISGQRINCRSTFLFHTWVLLLILKYLNCSDRGTAGLACGLEVKRKAKRRKNGVITTLVIAFKFLA